MRRPPLPLLATVLALSAVAFVHADDLVLSRFGEYLDALRVQAGIPGLAAAVVGPTDITWDGAFGQQDVERNIAAQTFTPFQLDGTTQAIVGSLAVRCASSGYLSLDDQVKKFAPSSPDASATIGQLLTHTTLGAKGLTFAYRPDRLTPVAAAVAGCTDSSFRWGLGAFFDRMAMVDSVPGADVAQLTAPAEAFTASALQRYSGVLRRLATPYTVDGRGRPTASSYVANTLTPASGLISTIQDLERFDLSLKSGYVLNAEWRTRAWTPPTDGNGNPLPHAYGWFVQNYNGGRLVWQFGVSDSGSSSMILMVPQRGITLILLANSPGLVRPFDLAAGDVTISPFAKLFLSVFVR